MMLSICFWKSKETKLWKRCKIGVVVVLWVTMEGPCTQGPCTDQNRAQWELRYCNWATISDYDAFNMLLVAKGDEALEECNKSCYWFFLLLLFGSQCQAFPNTRSQTTHQSEPDIIHNGNAFYAAPCQHLIYLWGLSPSMPISLPHMDWASPWSVTSVEHGMLLHSQTFKVELETQPVQIILFPNCCVFQDWSFDCSRYA